MAATIAATTLNPTSIGLKISNATNEDDITLASYSIINRTVSSSYLTAAMVAAIQLRVLAMIDAFVTSGDEEELDGLLAASIWVTDLTGNVYARGQYDDSDTISVLLTGIVTTGPMYVVVSMPHSLGPLTSPLSL